MCFQLGKELGKCTYQWTTNDEKNKRALSTLSVFIREKKKDRQQKKKKREAEKRTDQKEATKLNQGNFNLFQLLRSIFSYMVSNFRLLQVRIGKKVLY